MKVLAVSNPLITGIRALSLLELIGSRRGGVSFTAMSTELRIAAASLTRLLTMLLAEDWILQDVVTRHYFAGWRMLQLADDLRLHSPSLDLTAPIVYDLSHATGHSACFAMFQGSYFTLLAKTEQRRSYHFIDVFSPNYDWIENGMGQFLLAFQTAETVTSIYNQHFRMDVPADHWQRFAEIRRTKTFVRTEGFVTRVMAGVATDPQKPVEFLLSVAALTAEQPDTGKLLSKVKDYAKRIAQRLVVQGLSIDRSSIAVQQN